MEKELFSDSKPIIILGLIGMLLSLVFLFIIIIYGPFISPEGYLDKPFSFNAAVGLYLINLAAFLTLANFSEKGRKWWVWSTVVVFGLAYIIESVQPLRGVDPRFSNQSDLDSAIGLYGMGSLSGLMMILTIIFMVKIFISKHS